MNFHSSEAERCMDLSTELWYKNVKHIECATDDNLQSQWNEYSIKIRFKPIMKYEGWILTSEEFE